MVQSASLKFLLSASERFHVSLANGTLPLRHARIKEHGEKFLKLVLVLALIIVSLKPESLQKVLAVPVLKSLKWLFALNGCGCSMLPSADPIYDI